MSISLTPSQQTLAEFLIENQKNSAADGEEISSLILSIALGCKAISKALQYGALANVTGDHVSASGDSINVHGEKQKKLDVISNEVFIQRTRGVSGLVGLASEEMDQPYAIDVQNEGKNMLLVFDPLDGSSNIDTNVSVGSIFSILKAPGEIKNSDRAVREQDFFQPGRLQLAAGYAIYGPSTMIVLSLGRGVFGFTLDPTLGEFLLTHPSLRIPEEAQELAINASNRRYWYDPIQRYIDECFAGKDGARRKDFNMRWIASLVAEAHRILMRGGVFLYPRDSKSSGSSGRLRLLYEANPIGFLIEQAGGRVSNGDSSILDMVPTELHQKVGLIFGAKNEVDRIEVYHNDLNSEAR